MRRAPDDDDDDDEEEEGRACEAIRSAVAAVEPTARRRDGTRDEAARREIMVVFGEFCQRILRMINKLYFIPSAPNRQPHHQAVVRGHVRPPKICV